MPQTRSVVVNVAVSITWGVLFVGVLVIWALLFGVCIKAPAILETPIYQTRLSFRILNCYHLPVTLGPEVHGSRPVLPSTGRILMATRPSCARHLGSCFEISCFLFELIGVLYILSPC